MAQVCNMKMSDSTAQADDISSTTVPRANLDELLEISDEYGFNLRQQSNQVQQQYLELLNASLAPFDVVRSLDDFVKPMRMDAEERGFSYADNSEENPCNAWFVRTEIQNADIRDGVLQDRGVAVKDSVCVAGLPMMNGSAILTSLPT